MANSYRYTVHYKMNGRERTFMVGIEADEKPNIEWLFQRIKEYLSARYSEKEARKAFESLDFIEMLVENENGEYVDSDELYGEELEEILKADENEKWFGKVRWCKDDLINALEVKGFPATEDNIAELLIKCEHHSFTDCMISAGWDFIYTCIDNLETENKLT